MTEHEWLTSSDPVRMLAWRQGGPTARHPETTLGQCPSSPLDNRKLRLFCRACRIGVPGSFHSEYRQVEDDPTKDHWTPSTAELTRRWCVDDDRLPTQQYKADILREIVGNPFRPVQSPWDRIDIDGPCHWLTPEVLAIAKAAYEERPGQRCEHCRGYRATREKLTCHTCHGTGRVEDGLLDNARLAVLSDAMEEAGCPAEDKCPNWNCERNRRTRWECATCNNAGKIPNPLLVHLRSPGPYVRGCWALDVVIGRA